MRTVTEWIGRNDDTPPSAACKRRILERQGHVCALTGLPFDAKNKPKFDHKVPLWLGGENREKNLQALREDEAHKPKTKAEAKVRAKVYANIDRQYGLRGPAKKIRSAPFPISPKTAKRQAKQPLAPRSLFWPASSNPDIRDSSE